MVSDRHRLGVDGWKDDPVTSVIPSLRVSLQTYLPDENLGAAGYLQQILFY